jgi:crossover junction endodeoxyribonuclease RuvC
MTGSPFRGWILGVDPSLRGTGFSVVEVAGLKEFRLICSQVLKLSPKFSQAVCLGRIGNSVRDLLTEHPVTHVAVEETIYVQNFRTAQIMGMARGAVLASAAGSGHEVFEYAPLRIKQSVAGFGRASKEQVAGQIAALLRLPQVLGPDESDAAAVALCHALTWRGTETPEKNKPGDGLPGPVAK